MSTPSEPRTPADDPAAGELPSQQAATAASRRNRRWFYAMLIAGFIPPFLPLLVIQRDMDAAAWLLMAGLLATLAAAIYCGLWLACRASPKAGARIGLTIAYSLALLTLYIGVIYSGCVLILSTVNW